MDNDTGDYSEKKDENVNYLTKWDICGFYKKPVLELINSVRTAPNGRDRGMVRAKETLFNPEPEVLYALTKGEEMLSLAAVALTAGMFYEFYDIKAALPLLKVHTPIEFCTTSREMHQDVGALVDKFLDGEKANFVRIDLENGERVGRVDHYDGRTPQVTCVPYRARRNKDLKRAFWNSW
jgi:hypothetical protein